METIRFLKKTEKKTEISDDSEGEILIQDSTDDDADTDLQYESTASSDESNKLTFYLFNLVSFAVIGGFLFGYDTGVISGALLVIDKDYNYSLTAIQKELIVSVTIAAAALGAIIGGPSNELLGRRPTIMISSVIFSVGAILMSVAPIDNIGWILILLGRFIVGVAIGTCICTHI